MSSRAVFTAGKQHDHDDHEHRDRHDDCQALDPTRQAGEVVTARIASRSTATAVPCGARSWRRPGDSPRSGGRSR